MEGVMSILAIIFGLWIGYRSYLHDEQRKQERDRGKICPTCNGTGRFRTGQWGGFWDVCGTCGGRGIL